MAKINPIILTSGHPVHGIDITQTISLAHNHTLYTLYFPYSLPPYTQSVFSLSLSLSLSLTHTHTKANRSSRYCYVQLEMASLSLSILYVEEGSVLLCGLERTFSLKKVFHDFFGRGTFTRSFAWPRWSSMLLLDWLIHYYGRAQVVANLVGQSLSVSGFWMDKKWNNMGGAFSEKVYLCIKEKAVDEVPYVATSFFQPKKRK